MVGRVSTYMSHLNYQNRMLDIQNNYAKYSNQAITGKKSQNYTGIGGQTQRLISLENDLAKNEQYRDNNTIAAMRLENTYNAVDAINSSVKNFNSTMLDFTKLDLADFAPSYGEVEKTIEGGTGTTGDITFNTPADLPPNTIIATNADAFKDIKPGDKIKLEQNGAAAPNEGVYYVENVSGDGRSLTIAASTPVQANVTVPTGFDVNIGICKTEFLSKEKEDEIENMQKQAFTAMKELEFYLNTKVDGQYIFGGGQTDAEPVSFPFDNLEEFQAYYDGKTVTFPTTRAAMLVDMDFSGTEIGDLTFEQAAPDPLNPIPTKADQGTITSANPGAFIKDKVVASPATTGDITIDATKKTIAVEQEGAFSHIQAGDTLILGGADAGGAPPAGHAKAVYVERVSDDGRTIFLKEDTEFAAGDLNIATTPATDFTIGRSLPVGSTIELEGYDPMMDDAYTILGVSDDGTSLIVRTEENEFPANGTPVTHAQTTKSKIETNSYYKGDHLSINQRISDTKSLEIGINAEDAEFEKILRGLGILCQGNMVDERDPYAPNLASKVDPEQALNRTNQGMNLISDGLNHDTREQIERPGDLTRALQDISLKQTLVDKVQKEQKQYVDLLGLKINDIENADPTEAVVNLQREQLALSISYSVMAQVNSMSLINYLN